MIIEALNYITYILFPHQTCSFCLPVCQRLSFFVLTYLKLTQITIYMQRLILHGKQTRWQRWITRWLQAHHKHTQTYQPIYTRPRHLHIHRHYLCSRSNQPRM